MKFTLQWENSDRELSSVEIDVPSGIIDVVQGIEYAVGLYRNHKYTLSDITKKRVFEDIEVLIESKG